MTLANWRDLSIILLVFEAFVVGLVLLAIYLTLNVGTFQINRRINTAGAIVRSYFFRRAERSAKIASERIAAPFITAGATTARVKRWPHSLVKSIRTKNEV